MQIDRTNTLLEQIHLPADLRQLTVNQLPQVCDELRKNIIKELSANPGHFSSNLGSVELTVAMHYVFNTPYDRIVWDVGHQAYTHKMLTGRRERFSTNRQFKGVTPFPSPSESDYDTFAAGHAGNAVSAALGMAVAAHRSKNVQRKVVAVIGDGSITCGLTFEGLNNASSTPNDLLIILNDNNMAIDRAVGGMNRYLINLTTSNRYNRIRYKLYRLALKLGLIDEQRRKRILRLNNSLKAFLSSQHNLFEGLNIRYFGPIDGHDVVNLVRVMEQIKKMKGPKILHLHTQKGNGFAASEKDPTEWHAPGKFNIETEQRIKTPSEGLPPLFQDVFGDTLVELALLNDQIVGVTPAMPSGCSMNRLMEKMPNRAFDVGIAEGHAVTFSAGMAKEGLIPFCNVYSTFMQRAYDNIIHDIALYDLNVVLCLDRAGLVGEDGPTHHGVFDLAFLRSIPKMIVASPRNEHELRHLLYTAQLPNRGAFAIRYPRGRGVLVDWKCEMKEIPIGTGECLRAGTEIAILSLGPIANEVKKAIDALEMSGLSIAHYDMRFLKPLDTTILHTVAKRFKKIVTVEDGVLAGGFGSAILEFMAQHDYHPTIRQIGVPDAFIEHGAVGELYKLCKMDAQSMEQTILLLHQQA